jgi:hypothetical protein
MYLVIEILLFGGYLVIWLAPEKLLHRRPAMPSYARFNLLCLAFNITETSLLLATGEQQFLGCATEVALLNHPL